MEKEKTIFDFLGQVFLIYGITIGILAVLCRLFGEQVRLEMVSSMFRMGSAGIPLDTMWQFLATSFLITGLQYFFWSEWLAKRLTAFCRTICLLLSVVALMIVFIFTFDWFPVNMWQPWVAFLICFGICFTVSALLMRLKLRLEDRKLEEGLARLKKEWQEEE